jgi:hypothetical protein
MDELIKTKLMHLAEQKYSNIHPCNGETDFSHCFSPREEFGEIIFWFNDFTGSSHIVKESDLKVN